MAYSKTNWVNITTPINETNLNKIEQGIYDNSLVVDAITNTLNPTDTETYKTAELTEGQITDVIGVRDIVIKGQTSQNGEPTPATPQEIHCVKGNNVLTINNGNVLPNNLSDGTMNGITYTINGDKSINLSGTATSRVEPKLYNGAGYTIPAGVYKNTTAYNIIGYTGGSGYIVFNANVETILTKDVTFKQLYFRIESGATVNETIYPQIILSSKTDTSYVPHEETEYVINLGSLELCKIDNYQDYIYKNNGKWYKHKVIDKIVLNGDMNWLFLDSKKEIGIKSDLVIQISNALTPVTDSFLNETPLFSSHFVKGTQKTVIKGYNFIGFSKWGNDIYLYLPNDYDSIDTAKKWLNTNKPIVYYAISTPIEEEITDTTLISQLEAIYNAPLYEQTNITQTNNDLPMVLDITACKDNINGIKAFIRK